MINKRNYLIKESLKRKVFSRWFLLINIILFILILVSFHIDTIITFFGGDFKEEKTIIVVDKTNIYEDFKSEFLRIADFQVAKYKISRLNDTNILKDKIKNDSNIIGIELLEDKDHFIKANIYSLQGISNINKNIIIK